MKLTKFCVRNYRNILDSGWIQIEDIAVIVGKNESGKTSLLKALWKFNPFKSEPYSLDREWPRGKRKERDQKFEVVSTVFEFTAEEAGKLAEIDPSCAGLTAAGIGRTYEGKFLWEAEPRPIPRERNGSSVPFLLKPKLHEVLSGEPEFLVRLVWGVMASMSTLFENQGLEDAHLLLKELRAELIDAAIKHSEELASSLGTACDQVKAKMSDSPYDLAWQSVRSWIPTFIYMDDWLAFKGTAYLDQVQQRRDSGNLEDADETIITIMELSGLDLDEEVEKGGRPDREQRMLDMVDAGQTLTSEIAQRWSQKKYEVKFSADGHHFVTFVKDNAGEALVPLEERSKGFQWFFSFDMKFMYETEGDFKNAVILLDEPGLHLHAAAQADLLARFKAYAKSNQLVYTTHLPFMIDMNRLDNIWVAEERIGEGTKVHDQWATADQDARFTLQAAMGLSWVQSLFMGPYNLVVEGVTDYWFLSTMSTLFKEAGEVGLNDDLVITPAGGASKVAYLATLLSAQRVKVAALLDSDDEGKKAKKQLVHNWLLPEGEVILLGEVVGAAGTFAIEDLFDANFYLEHTAAAYFKELNGLPIQLPVKEGESIVDRLDAHFGGLGIPFNKGRVAKRLMKELAAKELAELSLPTVSGFRKAILAVNGVADRWRA